MNLSKTKRNIQNLKKINDIVEISKFSTINDLNKALQVSETAFEMAFVAKNIFQLAHDKYGVKNKFISNSLDLPNVWVFATLPSALLSTSYDKYFKIILKGFRPKKDLIVALGETAQDFARSNNFNIIYQSSEMHNQGQIVASTLVSLFINNQVNEIKFVLNSSKITTDEITVLPLDKLSIQRTKEKPLNPNTKFFPSMVYALESTATIYINRISDALIKEGEYFYLKEKLLRHETSLKSLETRIKDKTRDMNKIRRKAETEEMILITQNTKRSGGDHE